MFVSKLTCLCFGVSVFTNSYVLVWVFQCLQLGNKFKRGKLLAYQLICQMMLRPHQVPPSRALLARFYNVLHAGLISNDQVGMEVFERTLQHAACWGYLYWSYRRKCWFGKSDRCSAQFIAESLYYKMQLPSWQHICSWNVQETATHPKLSPSSNDLRLSQLMIEPMKQLLVSCLL